MRSFLEDEEGRAENEATGVPVWQRDSGACWATRFERTGQTVLRTHRGF